MIIRLAASLILLVGCLGLVYQLLPYQLLPYHEADKAARLVSSVIFILVGIALFAVSKPFSRVITRDL